MLLVNTCKLVKYTLHIVNVVLHIVNIVNAVMSCTFTHSKHSHLYTVDIVNTVMSTFSIGLNMFHVRLHNIKSKFRNQLLHQQDALLIRSDLRQ